MRGNIADEDFFNDDEDEHQDTSGLGPSSSSGGMSHADFAAESERFRTLGYHETYDQSKDAGLQLGFEEGYQCTCHTASRIGELMGYVVMQNSMDEIMRGSTSSTPDRSQVEASTDSVPFEVVRAVRNALADKDNHKHLEDLERRVRAMVQSNISSS